MPRWGIIDGEMGVQLELWQESRVLDALRTRGPLTLPELWEYGGSTAVREELLRLEALGLVMHEWIEDAPPMSSILRWRAVG